MDVGVVQPIRPHDVDNKGNKSIHVLAGRYAGAFALIGLTGFDLLLVCFLTAVPQNAWMASRALRSYSARSIAMHPRYLPLLPMAARSSSERP